MLRRLLRSSLTLFLPGLSFAFAIDEVEPNDDLSTANDATRATTIRGEIEPGASFRRDYFKIHPLITSQFKLHAEARILTGPFAGTESFDFSLETVTPPPSSPFPHVPFSVGSGSGSRVIRRESEHPYFATLFLGIGFPAQITSGTYEIRYTLARDFTPEDTPLLNTEVRRARGSDRVLVKIDTNTQWNVVMHRLTARASGHPRATIVSDYFRIEYINTPRGPNSPHSTSFEMAYQLKLRRPVTRLVIIAEDSGGLKTRETLVFRKHAVSRVPGSSRFPTRE